MTVRICN